MKFDAIIAVGGNSIGPWGPPMKTFERAFDTLARHNVFVCSQSYFYSTSPLGSGVQDDYVNGVIGVRTHLPAIALLKVLKRIERAAGRRGGRPWGPRTLDLDILAYRNIVRHWDVARRRPKRCRSGDLIIPHAHLHLRPFALVPLNDISKNWLHPVLLKRPLALLKALPKSVQGDILYRHEGR